MGGRREGFSKIQREHVEQACKALVAEGVARTGGSYFVRFGGNELPAKRVLREAYRIANGEEIDAGEFSGGVFTQRILEGAGFEVLVRAEGNKSA